MTVLDLISELSMYDPNLEVMIQQGEDFDYMIALTVKEEEVVNMDSLDDDDLITAVLINY